MAHDANSQNKVLRVGEEQLRKVVHLLRQAEWIQDGSTDVLSGSSSSNVGVKTTAKSMCEGSTASSVELPSKNLETIAC